MLQVLTAITGDPYFPGGMGVFEAPKDNFLVFEKGPSVDLQLQWATYGDAADECSLSRQYGGIHPSFDDIPGRLMGAKIATLAFKKANDLWRPLEWWEIPSQLITFIVIASVAGLAFLVGIGFAGFHVFRKLKRIRQGWNIHYDKDDSSVQMEEFDSESREVERADTHDPELE